MDYELVAADPAGNITVFVLDPVKDRRRAAKILLADPFIGAEQVGFVIPPQNPGTLWRLEMMGGEFCGNAARSFGLFAAREMGLRGRVRVRIEISGSVLPLTVLADTEDGFAEVEIPGPLAWEELDFGGRPLPAAVFEGITHILAPGIKPSRDVFFALLKIVKSEMGKLPPALGVMFMDSPFAPAAGPIRERYMTPAVYVAATDSLVFESSCGSGSAALGAWEFRNLADGEGRLALAQPGGVIEVKVRRAAGKTAGISIGGKVTLGGKIRIQEGEKNVQIN